MSLRKVANVVGLLQVFVGLFMLTSVAVSLAYGEDITGALLLASLVTLGVGALVYRTTAFEGDVTTREGFAIVTLAWTATAVAEMDANPLNNSVTAKTSVKSSGGGGGGGPRGGGGGGRR